MNNMKKMICAAAIALSATTMIAGSACAEVALKENASFSKVTDVEDIEGSSFYIYTPSVLENPSPMVTPVIYVYGDSAYESEDEAWDMIQKTGLEQIAEDEKAVIIVVNPVGDTWGKQDVDAFEGIMSYISFIDGEQPITYHTLQYLIGEGSGATFINNYMAAHSKRISAVMTFGGEIENPTKTYAVPAYLVSADQEAVDYYISINDGSSQVPSGSGSKDIIAALQADWLTEETDSKTTYTFASNDVKKVIVSKEESTTLDADLIEDCWNSLFRYTARVCLTANFWDFKEGFYNDEEFTLVKRPNYEAAGMEVVRVDGADNGIWEPKEDEENADNYYWYEFVPKAAQEASEGETFPLIICLHGRGDHPMYEAEFDGWAQVCIDNDVLMVAPNGSGDEELLTLLDYMIEKYPVDLSRIYIVGFSAGSNNTKALATAAPERFAAIAPQSPPSGPDLSEMQEAMSGCDYDFDLPILVAGQAFESESTSLGGKYKWVEALQPICNLNEISFPEGELDYSKYPYWGFEVQDNIRLYPQYGLNLWQGYLYDEDGVPMMSLMHSEVQTHTHYMGYAPYIWNYMSQFSRDVETKEIIYTPAE